MSHSDLDEADRRLRALVAMMRVALARFDGAAVSLVDLRAAAHDLADECGRAAHAHAASVRDELLSNRRTP